MSTEITKADLLDLLRRTNDPNWIEPLLADRDSAAIINAMLDQAVYLAAELQSSCDAATISLAPGGRPATSVLTLTRSASGIGGTIPQGYRFVDRRGFVSIAQTPVTVLAGALSVTVSVQTLRQTELANTIDDPGFSISADNAAVFDTGATNALIGVSPAPGGFPPIVSTTFTAVASAAPLINGVADYLSAHGNERGQRRQAGEPDGLYRTRVRNVQDAVSPIAVIQGALGAAQVRGLPALLLRESLNDQATASLKTSLSLDRFDEVFFQDGTHNTDFFDDAGIVPYREMVSAREAVKYFRLEFQAATTDPVTGKQFWETGTAAYVAAGSPGTWQDLNARPDMMSAILAVSEEANRKRAGGVAYDLFLRTPPKYQYDGSSASSAMTAVWTAVPPVGKAWFLADGLFGIDSSIPITGTNWRLKFTFADSSTFTTSTFPGLAGTLEACSRTMGGAFAKQIVRVEGQVQSDGTHAAHLVGQIWFNELAGAATFSPTPPGSPILQFDAQNVDLLNNSTMVDGSTISLWKNMGSAGSAGDATDTGIPAFDPTFVKVAAAGKIGNQSAIRFAGSQLLRSGDITALTQPTIVAAVVRSNTAALNEFVDGNDGTNRNLFFRDSSNFLNLYAGSVVTTSGVFISNAYHQVNITFNAGSSIARLDKTAYTVGSSPGTAVMDGITLGAGGDASGKLTGDLVEVLVWSGTLPTLADIEAYFDLKYGSGWPQT